MECEFFKNNKCNNLNELEYRIKRDCEKDICCKDCGFRTGIGDTCCYVGDACDLYYNNYT